MLLRKKAAEKIGVREQKSELENHVYFEGHATISFEYNL